MHEIPPPNPLPHEVLVIQKWLEEDVIGKGICPPLIKLFQRYCDQQGILDWSALAAEVDIETFRKINQKSEVFEAVCAAYLQFIIDGSQGKAAATQVIILPDFHKNQEYDQFIQAVMEKTVRDLLSTPEMYSVVKAIYRQSLAMQGLSNKEIENALNSSADPMFFAAAVVQGAFNPVYFYGREISDKDVADMSKSRGPLARQKMLSRAPYYLMQVVNGISSQRVDLIGNLDSQKLYQRNTKLALTGHLKTLEQHMRDLKLGK